MLSDRRRLLALPFLLLFLVAARQRPVTRPSIHPEIPADVYSFAQPNRIAVRHLALDLEVDFGAQMLRGTATLSIDNFGAASELVLDTRQLEIDAVEVDGRTAIWQLDEETAIGSRLAIPVTRTTERVTIAYSTGQNAEALTWTPAAQTTGRVSPYLFSQNEPDSARSWIPLQDTPTVRMTYEARIRVPSGLIALMSAENPTAVDSDGVYEFRMPQPIPSYLVAIAAGRIAFRPLDERSGVYAEPELLDDAAWDLQHIPAMIDSAERITGNPYPFDRYDVLLMPPIYTLGGMEHPRLNFINPYSVVTGNRPRPPTPSSLIAHELAHSWAGDLVTLATWSDVWLNEGVTSYLTNRILEEVDSPDRAEHAFMIERFSFADFAQNTNDPEQTRLHRPLDLARPFGLFNAAAYQKGSLFIKTIEDLVGRSRFDGFLQQYFARLSFDWVDDRRFLEMLRATVLAGDPVLEERLALIEWVYGTGLPSNVTAPTSSRIYDQVTAQVSRFRGGAGASSLDTSGWTQTHLDLFLLIARVEVERRMGEVDSAFALSSRTTPPQQFLLASAVTMYPAGLAGVERVLARGGTNPAVQSLYEALIRTEAGRDFAKRAFELYKSRYHPGVRYYLQELLYGAGRMANAA